MYFATDVSFYSLRRIVYFFLLFIYLFIYLFFVVLGMEPRDFLPPGYALRPVLYFILKQGLTKL